MEKSDKKWSNNYIQTTCTSSYHEENICKVSKRSVKSLRGVALKRHTYCLNIEDEKWLSSQCGKSDKQCSNNYTQTTCTSSYHEENTCKVSKQSMLNCKRSCAHKMYPLSIYWGERCTHCLYIEVKNDCSQCGKSDKNNLTIISKPHAHLHTMKKTCKVSKWSVQNCKRSCAHKMYPLFIYWGEKWLKFMTKNNLIIISKPRAHLHTMKKTHAKFQNDRYKTVRGVALTRHPE